MDQIILNFEYAQIFAVTELYHNNVDFYISFTLGRDVDRRSSAFNISGRGKIARRWINISNVYALTHSIY